MPNDTNGGFEQSRPPFFYSLKNNATMLSNMAANGNNCHEAQSMPTNSDEVYIKNTSAAEYHIPKRESYHVAKVNIFSNFHPVCLCLYGCVFIGNTTKNHETTKSPGRKQESSRPACAAFGIRKKRKEQKNCFFPGIS